MPRSWIENATPPTSIGRVEKAFGRLRTSGDQIQRAAPLMRKKRPSVTITTVSSRRALDRPDHDALDRDAADERDREREDERAPSRRARGGRATRR